MIPPALIYCPVVANRCAVIIYLHEILHHHYSFYCFSLFSSLESRRELFPLVQEATPAFALKLKNYIMRRILCNRKHIMYVSVQRLKKKKKRLH